MEEEVQEAVRGDQSLTATELRQCTAEGHNRPKWDKNHTAFSLDDFDDFGVYFGVF